MKKVTLFICAVCVTFIVAHKSYSQAESQRSFLDNALLEINFLGSTKQHNINNLSLQTNIGYYVFPNLNIHATWEGNIGLLDKAGEKKYLRQSLLGGGLGYDIVKNNELGKFAVKAMCATTIGDSDWKQTIYNVGVQWKLKQRLSPTLGLGFRHVNSRTSSMPNMNVVYGTIGIAF